MTAASTLKSGEMSSNHGNSLFGGGASPEHRTTAWGFPSADAYADSNFSSSRCSLGIAVLRMQYCGVIKYFRWGDRYGARLDVVLSCSRG